MRRRGPLTRDRLLRLIARLQCCRSSGAHAPRGGQERLLAARNLSCNLPTDRRQRGAHHGKRSAKQLNCRTLLAARAHGRLVAIGAF
eukprot:scaffold10944_cov28-Tisochrysis_lutea.AAC.4